MLSSLLNDTTSSADDATFRRRFLEEGDTLWAVTNDPETYDEEVAAYAAEVVADFVAEGEFPATDFVEELEAADP